MRVTYKSTENENVFIKDGEDILSPGRGATSVIKGCFPLFQYTIESVLPGTPIYPGLPGVNLNIGVTE